MENSELVKRNININIILFSFHYYDKRGWFRILGYGFSFKNIIIYDLMFSERIKKSGFRIGNWMFHFLKP